MQLELQDIIIKDYFKFLVYGDVSVCGGEENAKRLYLQYLDETKSDETIRGVLISNNILYYTLKIKVVDTLILALQECYSEEIADLIRTDLEFGYELSETSYLADIKKIVSECTRYKVKLKEWQAEESKIKSGNGEKPTIKYYYLLLENMSSVLGRDIRDDINTMRFCAAYCMFLDKLKTPQTNNGTRQNNRNI